jgi:hypothetical protein
MRIDRLQLLQGERWAGAVSQQPFEPGPVIGLDPNRGIDRETTAVVPLSHLFRIILFEITTSDALCRVQ